MFHRLFIITTIDSDFKRNNYQALTKIKELTFISLTKKELAFVTRE